MGCVCVCMRVCVGGGGSQGGEEEGKKDTEIIIEKPHQANIIANQYLSVTSQ